MKVMMRWVPVITKILAATLGSILQILACCVGRQLLRDEPFALRYWSWDFGYRIVILLLFFGLGRWL